MTLSTVALDDKYTLQTGRVFITGTQALVRLPIMQHLRDRAAGITSGCYISGYRGSPLGGFDQQLWAAAKHLKAHNIVFQPGVNEDLAATAVWGTQQAHLDGDNKYDGVYAIWYGKGPGVDRTGDAFRHGNLAGSAALGGVICLMGDDHTCESSTTAHQSEFAMVDAMMPILNPAGVQELLDYGLYGWALSRYSGTWVGLKCMKDTIDASASVNVDAQRVSIVIPSDFNLPAGGLNIRWPDAPLEQEARLHTYKLEAAKAFARANRLDQVVMDSPNAKLGIATCGKSYMDVRQALQYLGIDDAEGAKLGLRLFKIGMTWPLEPERCREICRRPRQDPRGRGKTRPDRAAVEGNPVRQGRGAGSGGQARRGRKDPVSLQRCARSQRDRDRNRAPAAGARNRSATGHARGGAGASGSPRAGTAGHGPHALFLFRLSAQHRHARPRGVPRAGRHRLPLHGAMDGSQHRGLHADGR